MIERNINNNKNNFDTKPLFQDKSIFICINQDIVSPVLTIFRDTNPLSRNGISDYITIMNTKVNYCGSYTNPVMTDPLKHFIDIVDFTSGNIVLNKHAEHIGLYINNLLTPLRSLIYMFNCKPIVPVVIPKIITPDDNTIELVRNSKYHCNSDTTMFNQLKGQGINKIKDLFTSEKSRYTIDDVKNPIAKGIGDIRRDRIIDYLMQVKIIDRPK